MTNKQLTLKAMYELIKAHSYREGNNPRKRKGYLELLYNAVQLFYSELEKEGIYPKDSWFGHEWNTLILKPIWGEDFDSERRPKELDYVDARCVMQSEIIIMMIHRFLDKRNFFLYIPHFYSSKATKEIKEYYKSPEVTTYTNIDPIPYKYGTAIFENGKWRLIKDEKAKITNPD